MTARSSDAVRFIFSRTSEIEVRNALHQSSMLKANGTIVGPARVTDVGKDCQRRLTLFLDVSCGLETTGG